MDKWVTKILLPLLLLVLAVAVYFESSSVKNIKLDNVYSTPATKFRNSRFLLAVTGSEGRSAYLLSSTRKITESGGRLRETES